MLPKSPLMARGSLRNWANMDTHSARARCTRFFTVSKKRSSSRATRKSSTARSEGTTRRRRLAEKSSKRLKRKSASYLARYFRSERQGFLEIDTFLAGFFRFRRGTRRQDACDT